MNNLRAISSQRTHKAFTLPPFFVKQIERQKKSRKRNEYDKQGLTHRRLFYQIRLVAVSLRTSQDISDNQDTKNRTKKTPDRGKCSFMKKPRDRSRKKCQDTEPLNEPTRREEERAYRNTD